MTDKLARRAFLMGFAASLAILFAPFDRFVERLRALLASVAEASDRAVAVSIAKLTDILKHVYSQDRIYSDLYYRSPRPFFAAAR